MIKKGVILAAGKGTRLLPLTTAVPKEMIRVGKKPTIEHVIDVLKAGDVEDILIIVGRNKMSIIDHLGSGNRLGVDIHYRVQEEAKGTANAVDYAQRFVGKENFVLIFGDNYFRPYKMIKDITKFHIKYNSDITLVLSRVKDPTRFGIVKIDDCMNIVNMIEKPSLEEAQKYKNVDGCYNSISGLMIINNKIFDYIKNTKIGKNDEIWLTDSILQMLKEGETVKGYVFEGHRYDIGTFESLLEADKLEINKNIL